MGKFVLALFFINPLISAIDSWVNQTYLTMLVLIADNISVSDYIPEPSNMILASSSHADNFFMLHYRMLS